MEIEQKLRNEAKSLLEQGKVDYIIGFAPGSLKFTTTPLITREAVETGQLVVNPFITNNLSVYLSSIKGRIGIVAKGCDSRAIVSLIQDKQVARENIVILGIPCQGVIDLAKIERLAGTDRDDITDITVTGENVGVTVNGENRTFPLKEALRDDCLECPSPTPQEYDLLIGEPAVLTPDKAAGQRRIAELEKMTPAQRWEFWKQEFSRCLRCYACRQVCPACFCERCFVEEAEPQWLSPVPRWQDNLFFQLTRVLHTAGRCIDCGECERACPAGIPLRILTRKMAETVGELFQYQPGADKEAPPFMTAYQSEETEGLFR